jgi:hypothetical protein
MSDLDKAMMTGAALASRAMLSAMLLELHRQGGEAAVQRVRIDAEAHLSEATRVMSADAKSVAEIHLAKETTSCAEGFLDDAFRAAYDAE